MHVTGFEPVHAPPAVADAYCASRLGGDWGTAFGTLPHTLDLASIAERARPKEFLAG